MSYDPHVSAELQLSIPSYTLVSRARNHGGLDFNAHSLLATWLAGGISMKALEENLIDGQMAIIESLAREIPLILPAR